ncbi:hypothetical protein Dimus_036832 [Dionaea muscipula]
MGGQDGDGLGGVLSVVDEASRWCGWVIAVAASVISRDGRWSGLFHGEPHEEDGDGGKTRKLMCLNKACGIGQRVGFLVGQGCGRLVGDGVWLMGGQDGDGLGGVLSVVDEASRWCGWVIAVAASVINVEVLGGGERFLGGVNGDDGRSGVVAGGLGFSTVSRVRKMVMEGKQES